MESTAAARPASLRYAVLVLRFAVPIALIAMLLRSVPVHDVAASASRVPLGAVVEALVIMITATAIGAYRWQILFAACGIRTRPRFMELFRAYWIGAFYNTYVPGGVGGEVVRGIATRRVVGPRGLTASLAIAVLERTLGLSGLLILVAASFTVSPLRGMEHVMLWSALGLGAAASAVTAIVSGPRIARFLPAPLGKIAAALPTIESLPHFALALAISVVTQSAVALFGHVVISAIAPQVTFADSLVIMPLIGASQYFPLTVGGAGVREAGFVFFYGFVHVSKADALAASLVVAALMYVANAMGGVLHAVRPLTIEQAPEAPSES